MLVVRLREVLRGWERVGGVEQVLVRAHFAAAAEAAAAQAPHVLLQGVVVRGLVLQQLHMRLLRGGGGRPRRAPRGTRGRRASSC